MSEVGLAAHSVRRAVAELLTDNCPPGSRIVLGVSGGADSLALAAAVAELTHDHSWQPVVVVVDHQLQAGSADVAAQAAAICQGLGLPDVRVIAVNVNGADQGIEAAARTQRHAALQQTAAEVEACAILLAHTLEDQAETVLMRLSRGSGVRSLAAMQAVTATSGVPLLRPLLGLRREQVRQSLAHHGLTGYEDPQNQDPRFLRARVRNQLLPVLVDVLGDAAILGLARTADLSRADADALDGIAAELLNSAQVGEELELAQLRSQPATLLKRVIRMWLAARGVAMEQLGFEQSHALLRLAVDPGFRGPVRLSGGTEVARVSGRLRAGGIDGSN